MTASINLKSVVVCFLSGQPNRPALAGCWREPRSHNPCATLLRPEHPAATAAAATAAVATAAFEVKLLRSVSGVSLNPSRDGAQVVGRRMYFETGNCSPCTGNCKVVAYNMWRPRVVARESRILCPSAQTACSGGHHWSTPKPI